MEEKPETLTIPEVAKILRVGKNSAYKLAKTKGFPLLVIGQRMRVPRKAFFEWISNQKAS